MIGMQVAPDRAITRRRFLQLAMAVSAVWAATARASPALARSESTTVLDDTAVVSDALARATLIGVL
jgi:hypothetical protein